MKATERIFHLSHTDLDGYGAQFMVAQGFYNCQFYNCDYKEIDHTLHAIIKQIKLELLVGKTVSLLLITDLNLNLNQAEWLTKALDKLENAPQLLLLDHHATGVSVAERYEWYRLNTAHCATWLAYEWVSHYMPDAEKVERLKRLAEFVEVTDLWKVGHEDFSKVNFLADMMFERPWYPPEFEGVGREYRFHLIDQVFQTFDEQSATVRDCERSLYDIKMNFLVQQNVPESILNDANLPLEHKLYHLILQLYLAQSSSITTIAGYKACIFYAWSGTLFQHLGSILLQTQPDIQVTIRVSSQGKLSLRSHDEQHNVSELAQTYFNGGGHPCAAGGSLPFDRIDSYESAVKQLKITVDKKNRKLASEKKT